MENTPDPDVRPGPPQPAHPGPFPPAGDPWPAHPVPFPPIDEPPRPDPGTRPDSGPDSGERPDDDPGASPFAGPDAGAGAAPPAGPGAPVSAGPGAPAGDPGRPRASRITTALLTVALVIVVATTGVLGTIAVLMTRNPDAPFGGTPPRPLSVPIHFAPVTSTQPAPCPGVAAVLDETGQTCYLVARGVDVTAVQKIEPVAERDGSYAVRVALAPAFRQKVSELTKETLEQQIVIVVGDRLVAAPRVAQAITTDSLVIAGSFTREQADALVATLLGTGPESPAQPDPVPPTGAGEPAPGTTGTAPAPGTTGTAPPGQGTTGGPASGQTGGPGANPIGQAPAAGSGGADPKFASCKEAVGAGYGPYVKETHEEYLFYVDRDGDGVACDSDDL